MGEDACWSLELVETAGKAGRDGKRCLLELVDSWKGGKRWETMVAGAGRDSWKGGKRWETMVAGAGRDSWTGG